MIKIYFIAIILLLTGCVSNNTNNYFVVMDLEPPTLSQFTHCYDYDCAKSKVIRLTEAHWSEVEAIFQLPAINAQQEREQLSLAIATFEKVVGALAGTSRDVGGSFKSVGASQPQQDCVDESTNTTTYLWLLRQKGWLHFHEVLTPSARIMGGFWPHQAAVIMQTDVQKKYAVDSWFLDNGQPAFIVPLQQWKRGWRPKT